MKKIITAAAAALITCSAMSLTSFAAEASADVFVSVSDENGKLAVAHEAVTVSDTDGDGKLTVCDALVCAHDSFYEGGAAAGFKASQTQYGISLDKLWGTENGGSYGYCVNSSPCLSLSDEIKSGDSVYAYVYPDVNAWSTTFFSWFDKNEADAEQGAEVELTLLRTSYDENYQMVPVPVEGADVTINGRSSGYKTDAEGRAVIKLDDSGRNVISAEAEGIILIPPVFIANVDGEETAVSTASATAAVTTATKTTATTAVSKSSAVSTSAGSQSPKTGDTDAAAALVVLGAGALTAFALRKKNEA